ncbi:helix-turn-helix transcriptional regulator [Ruminococcus sp.]|uniref:helix-turn-helix domain-containing protein n=1 Tax=Ruminococcus sp. TaxID=41978 RepID=UPI0025FEDA73|nr:helix-turn-helix transcriptional regulator [Ruminococcus sp.]
MTQYINDRRFSTIQRTDWNGELPEIISFTDFLRWNYTVDYGRYIRNLHSNNMLPLRLGIPAEAEIKTIIIEDGRYDRIDHDSFFMYVICNVLFINNGYSYQQKYVVHGCYRSGGSDFLMDIELYNGEYIHLDHPMDEFLVPILSKKDFENIADEIVEQYYPYKANYPCMINAFAIAKAMGLKVDYARLSNDGKVRSKIILDNRITTVYDDKKQEMPMPVYVPTILIDESLKETDEEQNAIIHECVHAYLHNLFYELQSHYRKIVGRRMPEFDDYFSSKSQQICLKWMETQACSIPRFIQMPADQTTDFILNFLDGIAGEPKWSDYRELIDLVKSKFGVARNTAKKRIIELGWLDVRGVYMYNGRGYVEDYDVDWDFPDNYTYTLSLRHISEAYSNSDTFAELIRTQRFIYTDGHVVLNTDKYVKKENGSVIGLTEYARHHMADCCIDFKKIYAEFDYSYTYGELHKDALTPINDDNRILTDEQRKKIRLALYELSDESMKLEVHPVQDEMARAVIFHMQRCGVTVDEVADRSGMGVDTVMKLRKGRKATGKFKLETILAFCVALELEEAFRVDLMHKARVEFDMENPAHRMYLTILDLLPEANVFQINDLLRAEGFTPWTRENEEPKRKARKKKEAV